MRRMWLAGVMLMGSSAGCGRGSEPGAPPPVTPITPGVPADAAAPPPPAPAAAPYDARGLLVIDGARDVWVGRLVLNRPADMTAPSEYCLEDGRLWRGAAHRLGRVNVFGLGADPIETGGDPVAVFAVERPSLDAAVVAGEVCPDDYGSEAERIQMRSDWVCEEGGFRTTHARLAAVPYLEASGHAVVALHEIVGQTDTETRLRLRNPFNLPLDGLSWELHYEGGPGKPMPTFVPITAPALPPGGSAELVVARTPTGAAVDTRVKRRDRLFGLVARGRVGRLRIDVELPVD